MTAWDFLDKYPQIKKYLLPITIGVLGLIFIIIGIVVSLGSPKQESISFQNNQSVQGVETGFKPVSTSKTKQIIVDVEGSVVKAGIYHLDVDSRLQEALIAAGGLSEKADRDFVQKHINLAEKLVDGQKVYIPKIGESIQSSEQTSLFTTNSVSDQTSGTVNINEATATQLDALPGIGQITAEKIINGRPYSDIQELLSRKIVSKKAFGQIKDKVSVY